MLFQTFDDPFRLVEFRGVVQQRGVRCRIEHQIVTVALGVGVDGVEDLFLDRLDQFQTLFISVPSLPKSDSCNAVASFSLLRIVSSSTCRVVADSEAFCC